MNEETANYRIAKLELEPTMSFLWDSPTLLLILWRSKTSNHQDESSPHSPTKRTASKPIYPNLAF